MKKPLVFLTFSLVANAALLAALYFRPDFISQFGQANRDPLSRPASSATTSNTTLSPVDAAALKRSAELFTTGDLRLLVARLRAAGFPGSIIRGIITAEVADQFGARRKAAVAHQKEIPYWRASQGSFEYDPKAGGEIARLGREQTQVLRDLLGPDAAASDDWSRLIQERKYGSLSQDKIDRLQDILADYNDLRSQFGAETRGIFLPEDQEKFQLLAKEQRADIVKLFTPDELAEYDMRTGGLGNQLRMQLSTFNASEDEFRTIFQLTQAANEKMGRGESGAWGVWTHVSDVDRDATTKQLQTDLAAALGPERYADYQLSMTPDFQTVSRLLTRFELPSSLAAQVVAVHQDIDQRAHAIRQDKTLSNEDRSSQLAALSQEAQSKLSTALGPQAYEAYKATSGGWVNNYAPQPPPPGRK